MNTTLQIRIDKKDKIEAQRILKSMGMDLTAGVKSFIKQVIQEEALPFQPRTANGYTKLAEARMLKAANEARKSKKTYNSIEELYASLK